MKRIRALLAVLLFCVGAAWTCAAEGEDAQALFRKGMDAFLQGDYDQAILWTAKSLQIQPDFKQSQDLLSVLVVEKEKGSQTEIWLGDKARLPREEAPAPTPDLSDIRQGLERLDVRVTTLEKRKLDAAVERRIQLITQVLRQSNRDSYDELKASQQKTDERLDRINANRGVLGWSLFWLFLLVVLSLLLSVWSLLRKGRETPG